MNISPPISQVPLAYIDAYNRKDLDGLTALFAPDAIVIDPVGTPPKYGRDNIRAFFSVGIEAGACLTLDGPVRAAAGYAAFPFHVDLEWEGKAMRIDVIDVFRLNDTGQIAEMTAYFGPENTSQGV